MYFLFLVRWQQVVRYTYVFTVQCMDVQGKTQYGYLTCAVIPGSYYLSVQWTTWCVSLLYVESVVQNIQRLYGPTFMLASWRRLL